MPAPHVGPLAEIDAYPEALVARVLDRVDLAHAHGDRQAVRLGNVAFAGRCTEALRVREDLRGPLAQLLLTVRESR